MYYALSSRIFSGKKKVIIKIIYTKLYEMIISVQARQGSALSWPKMEGAFVKQIWEILKETKNLIEYFPDYDKHAFPEKDYSWTIISFVTLVYKKMSPLKKSNSHNIKLYDFYLNMIHFILNLYNKYLVVV